jgi:MSHA biogenesis protein MshQ
LQTFRFSTLIALVLMCGFLCAHARAQVPQCSDVFPADITEDADETLDLPPFPSPDDGNVNWNSDVTLPAGTYYYDDLDIGNNVEVTITGPVLIFVDSDVSIGNNVFINNPGDPADFVLIGYQDIDIGNNTVFNGIIYSDDDVTLANNVDVTGAVTATDDVNTSPNTDVTYDPNAVENADFGGLCDNGGGGGGPGGVVFSYFMEEAQWTGSPGEVADSSGNGLDATSVGGATTDDATPAIPGDPGTCGYGDFRGNARRVTAPASALVNDADSFSVAGWVQMADADQNNGTPSIIAYGNTVGGSWPERYEVYIERNTGFFGLFDDWVFMVRKRNGNTQFLRHQVFSNATDSPLSGAWVHYVATYDSSRDEATLYVNGTPVAQDRLNGPNRLEDASGGLGLMGHPGGQFDGVGLQDEVYMFADVLDAGEASALFQNTRPCQNGYDHIRLTHPATGLTCSPSSITVQACADASCSALFPDPVDVDFTSPTATWTPDPVSFTGSTTVSLQYTTPGFATLDAVAIDPSADNPTRCFSGGAETNCEMEFFESGFVIDVPDHIADTSVTGSIAAVRADPADPTQCVPGFDNVTKNVGFWSDYVNPASGSLAVGIDATPVNTNSPGTLVPIAFDGNGLGSFELRYPDVGDVNLNARFEGSGDEAGLVMFGEDRFISRPARFSLSIPGNPAATDHTGDVFTTAGTDFEVTVAARNASDGITPNFGNETPAESVDLELALVEPAGGSEPGLVGSFGAFGSDCDGNPATPGTACGGFSWPEVGVISLTPRLSSGAYIGTADVIGTAVDHVGRFIPAYFELGSGDIIDRAALGSCTGSPFTYIGERFDVEFTLYARNEDGNTTANYDDVFAFLQGGDLDLSASPSPNIDAPGIGWMLGVGDASASLTLPRTSPVAPYDDYEVSTNPIDSDGVALSGSGAIDSTELRFGRIAIDNAIGSELAPLVLPWRSEYWSGTTWLINEIDDCTTLDRVSDVALTSSDGDTGDGNETVSLGGGSTSIDAPQSDLTLNSGLGSLYFTAPNASGWVDVLLTLDNRWSFLRDDLDDDGDFAEEPEARASFGLFDGNSQRIYIREIAPQ